MLSVLATFAVVLLALSAYSVLLIAVFCGRAFHNGHAKGYADALADRRSNVRVIR